MPGQYKHLAPALARDPKHRVVFLTQRTDVMLPGVTRATYKPPRAVKPETHPYLRLQESAVLHGQQVARSLVQMQQKGFRPDLVIGHPGWGELLFVRDVLPDVPIVSYAEFFYRGTGADVGFDPADDEDLDAFCRARTRSSHLLLSLEACTRAVMVLVHSLSRFARDLMTQLLSHRRLKRAGVELVSITQELDRTSIRLTSSH